MIRSLILVAALLGPVNCSEAAKLTLVEDGRSNYRIVLPEGSSPSEHWAASELKEHLRLISGVVLPIVPEKEGPSILIGSRAAPKSVDLSGLGDEGFVVKTVGEDLVIAGGRLRGTMYGVYDFLEDVLGCRWYSSKVSKIPKTRTIEIRDLDIRETPAFEFRDVYYKDAWQREYAARNRYNGHHMNLDAARGGKVYYNHFAHTFRELVPISKYGQSNPEYYSLIKGERHVKDYDTQLCLTNPDVLKIATASVLRWIEEDPNAKLVSVSANDLDNRCECDKCKAADEEEGGAPSGTLLRFVNAIAAEVEKKYPGVLIDTLAYWYTEWPPKLTKPAKNVAVRYCPIWACQTHPYDTCPENKSYLKQFTRWQELSENLYIWHYVVNFVHYLAPFPNFDELAASARLYHKNGVKGIFWQGNGESEGDWEFSALRAWVLAKLSWNPEQDVRALAHDFISGYYGKAAPYIQQYFDLMHDTVRDKDIHITGRTDMKVFPPELVEESDRLFELAEKAAADDRDILRRVQIERTAIQYVQFARPMHMNEYKGRETELLARLETLVAKAKGFGMSRPGGWIDWEGFYKGNKKKLGG